MLAIASSVDAAVFKAWRRPVHLRFGIIELLPIPHELRARHAHRHRALDGLFQRLYIQDLAGGGRVHRLEDLCLDTALTEDNRWAQLPHHDPAGLDPSAWVALFVLEDFECGAWREGRLILRRICAQHERGREQWRLGEMAARGATAPETAGRVPRTLREPREIATAPHHRLLDFEKDARLIKIRREGVIQGSLEIFRR